MKRVNPKMVNKVDWFLPSINFNLNILVHFIIIREMESREEHILSVTDQISRRIYE